MTLILTILLVLLLLGALPSWPHMASYGYSPVIVIAVILIAILLFGGHG